MKVNGVNYHVERRGQGEPLVLLHGFTGSAEGWRHVADALAAHFTTIAVDLLGHGQTDAPADPSRYAIDRAAADLIALLDALGLPTAHWLGYSMGGRLALYLAVHHPDAVKALILESASPGLANDDARLARLHDDTVLAERIERDGAAAFVDYWENISLFATQRRLPAETRAEIRAGRLKHPAIGLANSLRGMGTGAQPSLWDNLPALTMPTLLVAGELDAKFVGTARQMREKLPDARLVIIPDAGHTVHLEQPQVFIEAVLAFLRA